MNKYFSMSDKVYDVTEQYPALLEFLAINGFENLRNDIMRKTIGKTISIETALRSKKLDAALFEKRMVEIIENDAEQEGLNFHNQSDYNQSGYNQSDHNQSDHNQNDQTQRTQNLSTKNKTNSIKMSGILPCPIRLQLLEKLDSWILEQQLNVTSQLQAASMGLDWLKDEIKNSKDEDDLADIYLSAGFSLFYDRSIMGRYMEAGVFQDLTSVNKLNHCFDNETLDLKDPLSRYTIIGVVPAVFMVNTELLGERPLPKSWADLLKPEFENTIALPMRDLDLFNAVLLGIYQTYGEEGVKRLGHGLLKDMHPAQMVKTGRKKGTGPLVTVMPYFFTLMAGQNSTLKTVWPKDGAIISPIFLLTKASAKEKIQPLVNFIFSKELGNVLTANGKFPSTHPDVDNQLGAEQGFMWPGWDFIHANDISKLLYETEQIFLNASGGDK